MPTPNENLIINDDHIVINFTFGGKTETVNLALKPTKPNIKYAKRVLSTIQRDIKTGCFQYHDYFPTETKPRTKKPATRKKAVEAPQLKGANEYQNSELLFSAVAWRWSQTLGECSKGTRKHYRNIMSKYWLPLFGAWPIDQIQYSDLKKAIGGIEWTSAKNRNNSLVPLRRVFDLAFIEGIIEKDPMKRIRNQRLSAPVPNPLSKAEIAKILEYMEQHLDEQVSNYFQFAFYTGLRIEEQIALRWSDVDTTNNHIHINKAQALGEEKCTKTGLNRYIDLNTKALEALEKQAKHTRHRGDYVFLNPVTMRPWNDNGKAQRLRYWTPTLAALGIPHRRAYETRHAYATMLLMSGCEHAYAAAQMGHSIQVFLQTYSRWARAEQDEKERNKLAAFIDDT